MKPGVHFVAFAARLNRLRKKARFEVRPVECAVPGLKARVVFVGFMRGLKPPPPSVPSFSAACEAVPFQNFGLFRGSFGRFSNSLGLFSSVRGGFFLKKEPLGGCGFAVLRLQNRK
jgi:hypothetical protein